VTGSQGCCPERYAWAVPATLCGVICIEHLLRFLPSFTTTALCMTPILATHARLLYRQFCLPGPRKLSKLFTTTALSLDQVSDLCNKVSSRQFSCRCLLAELTSMLQTHMDHQGHCKVAVGQMTATSDRDANFLTCKQLAQVCSEQTRADYVVALHGNLVSLLIANPSLQMLLCSSPCGFQPTCARHTSVLQRCVLCTSVFVLSACICVSLSVMHAAHALSMAPPLF
jgi:hypothetical protein